MRAYLTLDDRKSLLLEYVLEIPINIIESIKDPVAKQNIIRVLDYQNAEIYPRKSDVRQISLKRIFEVLDDDLCAVLIEEIRTSSLFDHILQSERLELIENLEDPYKFERPLRIRGQRVPSNEERERAVKAYLAKRDQDATSKKSKENQYKPHEIPGSIKVILWVFAFIGIIYLASISDTPPSPCGSSRVCD
jgi:hypothetical protein